MSKLVCVFVGMVLAVFLYAAARAVTTPAQASPSPPPAGPKCARERRMHAYGTYQAHYGTGGGHGWTDAPIDLTIVECLEWEAAK